MILIILCVPGSHAGSRDYITCINDALDSLETGQTRDALKALDEAVDYDANDPLAHVVLGLTLVMGSRPDDALVELESALRLDSRCAEACYIKGLVYLYKNKIGDARDSFGKCASLRSAVNPKPAIEYCRVMGGDTSYDTLDKRSGCLERSIYAYLLIKQGNKAEAAPLFNAVTSECKGRGYGDTIGCSMSFIPDKPLKCTGWPLKQPYSSLYAGKNKYPIASGRTNLRADLSRAENVRLVTFFVDNRVLGITNTPPFQFSWDTSKAPNGVHTIRIEGCDALGTTLCQKMMRVTIENDNGAQPPTYSGIGESWNRLRGLMEIKPSMAALNYYSALCSESKNDIESVICSLEKVLAADPEYLDSADKLAKYYALNRAMLYNKANRTNEPVIAVTFDDGPKETTPELLDLLKSRGVRATFFVVGKQVEARPEMVKRMADEGHQIENHTYNHRAMDGLSTREIIQELFGTIAAIRTVTGNRSCYVRPPGGRDGNKFSETVKRFGLAETYWTASCSSLEGTNSKRITEFLLSSAAPGAVFHLHNMERVTFNSLVPVIDELKSKGYRFVTLNELAQITGVKK